VACPHEPRFAIENSEVVQDALEPRRVASGRGSWSGGTIVRGKLATPGARDLFQCLSRRGGRARWVEGTSLRFGREHGYQRHQGDQHEKQEERIDAARDRHLGLLRSRLQIAGNIILSRKAHSW